MILGENEMLGTAVSKYMRCQGHEVIGYSENLYEQEKLRACICDVGFDAVINCTAVVNQHAEEDKAAAVYINAFLPHYLEQITEGTNTIIVHRSTDCVFSGERGQYTVLDIPDGESFYARTKAIGELQNEKDITIRTSLIGLEDKYGEGLLSWFLRQRGKVGGYANAIWTGITTYTYARMVEVLLAQQAHGLFHLVPDEPISKHDLLCLFEKYFPGEREIVRIENKRVDKSLVPYTGSYDVIIPSYEMMIKEISNEKN